MGIVASTQARPAIYATRQGDYKGLQAIIGAEDGEQLQALLGYCSFHSVTAVHLASKQSFQLLHLILTSAERLIAQQSAAGSNASTVTGAIACRTLLRCAVLPPAWYALLHTPSVFCWVRASVCTEGFSITTQQ